MVARFPLVFHSVLNEQYLPVFLVYSIPPYKRSPYEGRIPLSDIFGRRRPVGFVKKFHPIRVEPCK
jgi:hypothetical protein